MRLVRIVVPPDKSISHRAVILSSISEGTTRIKNLLLGDDCLWTIEAFRAMGVKIEHFPYRGEGKPEGDIVVHGVGLYGLRKPARPIYLGNSGTTMRLLPGVLAGQDFEVILRGDSSLSNRPMMRIVQPLRKMGATIEGRRMKEEGCKNEIYPPLKIKGRRLKAIRYNSEIASAQVKSCVLLAGLFARGRTSVSEPIKSRDHTERMLRQFGADIRIRGCRVSVNVGAESYSARNKVAGRIKNPPLRSPGAIVIPRDISSASFFIVAGCIGPDIEVVIENVGLNPTRTGILDILKRMGADLEVKSQKLKVKSNEPFGDVIVRHSRLKGITISPGEVVSAIDEIPIIMVAGCFAEGKTIIEGVEELHLKETDRIKSMVTNLRKMGADITVGVDLPAPHLIGAGCVRHKRCTEKIIINGGSPLHRARVSSYGDHRTAMSMLIAGLFVKGKMSVSGLNCIDKSFPGFLKMIGTLDLN